MLEKSLFKDKFGSWYPKIEPLFDNGEMDKIYDFLKFEGGRGKKIAPVSDKTYRCFIETPIDQLKIVIVGLCPYHTVHQGKQVADGLLMSCSNHTNYFAPSLEKYYEAIEQELYDGLCLNCERTNNLQFLANQGVLMYNAALTTEINKAKSHQEIWKNFTKHLFEEVFSVWNIPVIFLGKEAAEFSKYLAPMQWNFKVEHPAFAARNNEKWKTDKVFTKVNRILRDINKDEIEWLLTKAPF